LQALPIVRMKIGNHRNKLPAILLPKETILILKTLRQYLSNFLKKYSSQDTKFHIDDPKLKNILEILKLTLHDERGGLGTYNLLFIAAELLHLKKENYVTE